MWKRVGAQLIFVLVLAVPAAAAEGPMTIKLRFIPQESTHASTPSIPPALLAAPVEVVYEDGRELADKHVVGEVVNDNQSSPIRASDDVADFAKGVFLQAAADWGLKVTPGSNRVLTIKLIRYFVSQNHKAVGAMFGSEARAVFTISERKRLIWQGNGSGSAHRYGKRNEENLNEVLSDAMKEAYANGLSDSGLAQAMNGGGGGVSTAAIPASDGVSPSQLLSELVDLKKQGFTNDLLVQYISQKTLSSEMTGKDLSQWKQSGMPPEVIKAALGRSPGAKPDARPAAGHPPQSPKRRAERS